MFEGGACQHASARCALHEALLQQKRFHNFLDGIARFPQSGRDRLDADWPAVKTSGDQLQIPPVEGVQSALIDFEAGECFVRNPRIDLGMAGDRGKIPDPFEQAPCNARRASCARSDFACSIICQFQSEDAGASYNNRNQFIRRVEIETYRNAKAIS